MSEPPVQTRPSPAAFVSALALSALGFACAVLAINAFGLWHWGLDGAGLYRYQMSKLKHLAAGDEPPVDTILVGDSSLGNAINARLLSELTGGRAVNLALTGNYGYAGSLNMMRRAAGMLPALQRVVIMHTPGMAGRAPALDAWALTSPAPLDDALTGRVPGAAMARDLAQRLLSSGGALQFLQLMWPRDGLPRQPSPARDYVPQRTTAQPFGADMPAAVAGEKLRVLQAIARFCAGRNLDCTYAHGPIAAEVLETPASRRFLATANRLVTASGLDLLAPRPLALARNQIGDSLDHVAPDWRVWSTRWLAEILLQPSPPTRARVGGPTEAPPT